MMVEYSEYEGLKAKSQMGSTGAQISLMQCMRQNKVHQPDVTLIYGGRLLKECPRRLGDDQWAVLEQVLLAALELQTADWADYCIKKLVDKFPTSIRVKRLKGMYFESGEQWQEAERIYKDVIREKPEDTSSHKRLIAMYKQRGRIPEAIEQMLTYLDTFSTDIEVWQELGELYIEAGTLQRAVFCWEELILSNPRSMYFCISYAELLYSTNDCEMARKYYSLALHLDPGNIRALWGFIAVAAQMIKKDESNEKMTQLTEFASERLRHAYKSIGGVHSKVALALIDAAASPYEILKSA